MSAHASQVELAGHITCVGVDATLLGELRDGLGGGYAWEPLRSAQRLHMLIQQGLLQADVVVLGSRVEQPIAAAQRIHSFDKTIPVLIVANRPDCAALRREIMFAPLLGSVVTPWDHEDTGGLLQAIGNGAEQHRQRRQYLDTIASVQPKLGALPISQPEVGHYLGRLLDQAPIGVVGVDERGHILGINARAGKILAIPEREAIGQALAAFLTDAARPRLANLLARSAVAKSFGMDPVVIETRGPGAQIRYLEATASPLAFRPQQRGFMVILQDVSGRERAEYQRQLAEDHRRRLSGALEQAADAVVIADSQFVIEYVNPAFEVLTGYPKHVVLGQELRFLLSDTDDDAFYVQLWKTVRRGEVFRGVVVNRRQDGTIYHEEKTISPLRDEDGVITHYISTGRDITARLAAEQAVRRHQNESAHAARLSTLGEMTSGLAHELNQPLCAIKTYAQTCLRVIRTDGDRKAKLLYGLEQVVKQAELAGAIFERLRNFARKGEISQRSVDLREVINEALLLVDPELSQNRIRIHVCHDDAPLWVHVDPVQIEQVLLNLIRNAIDAVANLDAERRVLNLAVVATARQLKISLSDRGLGCPDDAVDHLFEPFFTTKPAGLGIGLGISQSIIDAHGGRLYLDANADSGATFSFTLPEVEGES